MFWYCHKRGREVRLEKERLFTESEFAALDEDTAVNAPTTTPAPTGVSVPQVEAVTRQTEDTERQQHHRAEYAEGGSLAQELKKGKHEGRAGDRSQI